MNTKSTYKGWEVFSLKNKFLQVDIVPELGGRIMRFILDDYNFFFVNKHLEGEENIQPSEDWDCSWMNFGGEKIWPAPQGWSGDEEWPGPPDPVLDGGYYRLEKTDAQTVRLTSPDDEITKLRIRRTIKISKLASEVEIKARFFNISQQTCKWSVWPVIQMDTPDSDPDNYQIVIPVKESSLFPDGYYVMHGLANNPQYQSTAHYLTINYQYLIGKIGTDTDAGWVAYIDKKRGRVFIATYHYDSSGNYPENTSVQIWTQGYGMIYSRNRLRLSPDDREINPAYMEIELLSPLQEILPGESIEFSYKMKACTIEPGIAIESVHEWGIVASHLQCQTEEKVILITGSYGFFSEGSVLLKGKLQDGSEMVLTQQQATPLEYTRIIYSIQQQEQYRIKEIIVEFIQTQQESKIDTLTL